MCKQAVEVLIEFSFGIRMICRTPQTRDFPTSDQTPGFLVSEPRRVLHTVILDFVC